MSFLSRKTLLHLRKKMSAPLIWIDCEMTGLNTRTDRILEISCFVTNGKLDLLEPNGFTRVLSVPQSKLDGMDEWCQNTHGKSGLIEKVRQSTNIAHQVQEDLLEYLKGLVEPKAGVLAGNSVHMDRIFLINEFPKLIDYLHYRIVDVSSIKEIGYRHNPELMLKVPQKKMTHTAKEDILESIEELKWYYNNYLKGPQT